MKPIDSLPMAYVCKFLSKDVRAKAHFPVYKNGTCVYFLFESHFISSTKNHRALIKSLGHKWAACLHLKCVMQYAFSRLKAHFCFGCAAPIVWNKMIYKYHNDYDGFKICLILKQQD